MVARISMEVEVSNIMELRKIEHHAEYLLDLESWPEIKRVFNVRVEEQPTS